MVGLLLLATNYIPGNVLGSPVPIFWWIVLIVATLGLIIDLVNSGNLLASLLLLIGEVFVALGGIFIGWVIVAIVCIIFSWSPQGLIWWAWLVGFTFLRIMWHVDPETRKGY